MTRHPALPVTIRGVTYATREIAAVTIITVRALVEVAT